MRVAPSVGSIVAPTDAYHWGQVLLLPTAYAVVEIEDETGGAREAGLTLLGILSERLSESIVSLSQAQELAQGVANNCVASLVLLVPVGMTAYLVLVGGGAVYIKRGERIATLLDAPGSLSGQLEEGDTVLLATKRLVAAIGDNALGSAFDAEKLTVQLSENDAATGAAGLVFGVIRGVPVEEEQVPVPTFDKEAPVGKLLQLGSRFRGKNGVLVAVALMSSFLFFGSVVLGIKKQFSYRTDRYVTASLTQAQHAHDEGVALLDLNPVKGRQRLSDAKLILDALAATVSAKTKTGRQIAALSKDVGDRLTMAMQVHRGEPQLFYDAGLLKKGATVSSVSLKSEQLAILDVSGGTVFLLAGDSKKGQIIAGGEQFAGSRLVGMHGDKVYVLVADGVHRIRTEDKKTEPFIIKKDSEWGAMSGLVAFGGNLYLLDTAKSRIWKYTGTETGFSERREYLNPDTLPDLSRAMNMAIDGSVWLGTSGGSIMRFTQGAENTFLPKGVTPDFGKNLVVYTSDEVKRVYVLDRDNKRVVIVEKDGEYLAQYVWEGSLLPSQVVVSESLRKIFLVADGKIYVLEMK